MLSDARNERLNAIISDLVKIEGVASVLRDDYDSHSVKVFVNLAVASYAGGITSTKRPSRFEVPLRNVAAAVRRLLRQYNVGFVADLPKLTYVSVGGGEKVKDAYTGETITLNLEV